jgi:dihydroflavonol-4-reductase
MRATQVLVTGATGFLGRHVLDQAGARHVLALVRNPDAWPYENDTDWYDDPNLKGIDTVLHLAGHVHHSREHSEDAYSVNVDGTLGMVRFAAHSGARLIIISTSGVVGCFRDRKRMADEDSDYVTSTVAR